MKGILIVWHGSRQDSAERTMAAIAQRVKSGLPGIPAEVACMGMGDKDIPSGLSALIRQGADEIVVAPYFLFNGIHMSKDIPEIIRTYCKENPNLKIIMANPLGFDERLAEVLTDRIKECL